MTPRKVETAPSTRFRDRIVELRRVKASELRRNPQNWRQHPASQRSAMESVLAEIGFAGAALAYVEPDGALTLIDGRTQSRFGAR